MRLTKQYPMSAVQVEIDRLIEKHYKIVSDTEDLIIYANICSGAEALSADRNTMDIKHIDSHYDIAPDHPLKPLARIIRIAHTTGMGVCITDQQGMEYYGYLYLDEAARLRIYASGVDIHKGTPDAVRAAITDDIASAIMLEEDVLPDTLDFNVRMSFSSGITDVEHVRQAIEDTVNDTANNIGITNDADSAYMESVRVSNIKRKENNQKA